MGLVYHNGKFVPEDRIQKIDESSRALLLLRPFLDKNEPELVRFLVNTWNAQGKAITYKELREAILAGDIDPQWMDDWMQDYTRFVTKHMQPAWDKAIAASVVELERKLPMWKFDPMGDAVRSWTATHAAAFVTNVTTTQIEGLRAVVRRAAVLEDMSVDELARAIRPMVGLTRQQATANLRYFENLKSNGVSVKRAQDLSTRYAARQHRLREYTIARTELATAYNTGADSTTMAVGSYLKVGDMCVINFTVKGVAPTTKTRLRISGLPFPLAVTEDGELRTGGGTLANYMSPAGNTEPEIYFMGWLLNDSGNIYARGCHADGTQDYIDVISTDANSPTTFTGSGTILYHTQPEHQSKIISVNHRGYNLEAPENTLPAFILSAEKGFTYVECDVAFTKDGVAVLLHDDTIDRTSNGTGAISDLYYKDLVDFDFGSWFDEKYAGTKIPTFSEFMECCKEYNLHPYIEIKDGSYTESQIQQIVDLVYAHGMIHNSTFISFNSQFLTWVKNYCDVARLGFIEKTPTQAGIDTALSLKTSKNYVYLSTKYTNLTDSIITLCKENNLPR